MRIMKSLAVRSAAVTVATLFALTVAAPVGAQVTGNGFLFKQPQGTFTLFGGYTRPNAAGDLFDFTTKNLTVSRNDFSTLTIGFEAQYTLLPQLDVSLGVSYSGSGKKSEFRDWEDNKHQPIEQKTSFQRIPVTASLKYYLMPRGHSISRFAWVPSKYAPFIGAGAGAMWYSFRQEGDFIDFDTGKVFPDTFKSTDWAGMVHAMAGFEYSLSPRYSLTTEARYTWANGDLSKDFSGFKEINLSGFSTTIGVSVRF